MILNEIKEHIEDLKLKIIPNVFWNSEILKVNTIRHDKLVKYIDENCIDNDRKSFLVFHIYNFRWRLYIEGYANQTFEEAIKTFDIFILGYLDYSKDLFHFSDDHPPSPPFYDINFYTSYVKDKILDNVKTFLKYWAKIRKYKIEKNEISHNLMESELNKVMFYILNRKDESINKIN